ncbi:ABC-2 type transport system permease protein [Cytobacillus eiseniae]|uniref:ABC-2 type transport system permease protein n=1 Tax=Cytobacillus eiseniae TaxID=762947 RepID=A0ABS4RDU6_9BACI|nr:ABC transporter permease [Cytobacillus eiseniae]MBP2241083.1 ABC-2 type transport system permease protein [Cytobacillus eiseniae]
MFDEKVLWKERLSKRTKELSSYLRYIFNGHIVIVLVFLLGTAAFYYQQWLTTVPEQFPAAWIMAIVLASILTYSPIFTFLSEADRIFLLPLENRLNGFFQRAKVVSFFLHAYLLIMGLAVFMPMYARVNEGDFQAFLPFLLAILVMKVFNLLIRWQVQYYVEKNIHLIDSLIRFAVNTVFLFFLFSNEGLLFLLPEVFLLVLLLLFYRKSTSKKGLKWEFLIEQEERRMSSFYRFANMFTDVPNLRDRVKRRQWLDWVFRKLAFKQENSFHYLYIRTFLRAGDYFGLFVRLTLIGAGGIYLLSFGYGQVLLMLLFMYLTGFQLLPLWNHHQNKLWVNLYPIEAGEKGRAFKKILANLLYVQAILLSIVVLLNGELLLSIISFVAGMTFSYFFAHMYAPKKLSL